MSKKQTEGTAPDGGAWQATVHGVTKSGTRLSDFTHSRTRVNIDILGISELNGLEWVTLIQMTIISTTVGKNPLEEMEQPSQSTKQSEMQYLGAISKMNRMMSVHFQGKPFNITVIQIYTPTSNAEETEVEWFYEDLQELLELTPNKRCPFHHRDGVQKQDVKRYLE